MKTAVVYTRVSTEEQTKGYSLDGQERIDRDFAASLGYEVINVFREEGISAKDLNRPQLQNLMSWVREHAAEVDAVVFWKWERISRGTEYDYAVLGRFFDECKVAPLSATECNEDSPEGELLRWITKGTALYERRKISQRTAMGMEQKAREGIIPCKAPIGYKNYTLPDEKKIVIVDEEKAPFIKRAFELYATGNYSLKRLGDTLYLDGFRHPKTGEKFPPRKFEWMLHNPFYIGRFEWSGEWYEGSHTPIISKELFYRVQARFNDIDRTKKHDVKFAYTGLIKCAECGCYLTAEFKRGKNKKGHYIYYHCANSKGVHKSLKCHREEKFDNTFANILETIHLEQKHIEHIRHLASEYLNEFIEYEQRVVDDIKQRIDVITKRIKNSYIDKLEGRIPAGMSEAEFNSLHKEWQEEKDRLIIRLGEANISSKHVYQKIEKVLRFSEHLPELFLKAEPEEKKLIISTMTKSVKFDGENLIVNLKDTFKALQNVKKCVLETSKNDDLRTRTTLTNTKKDPHSEGLFEMGRMMGFEPTNTGTTIRGLNRLATPAITFIC